jgi:hypothetical protein
MTPNWFTSALRWQFLIVLATTPFAPHAHPALAAEFHPIGYIPWSGPGPYNGPTSVAYAVSDDGSVAVGNATLPAGSQAVMWSLDAGLQSIGNVPDELNGIATDMSRDGKTVLIQQSNGRAIWTQDNGFFYFSYGGFAYALSPDGQAVVGSNQFINGGHTDPAYWTQADGWVSLGKFPEVNNPSRAEGVALAMSADHNTVVGFADYSVPPLPERAKPFRWTAQTGIQAINLPPGYTEGAAFGVSDDGSVIVGVLSDTVSGSIFRWTATEGMRIIADYGTSPVISGDGKTIGWSGIGKSVAAPYEYRGYALVWDTEQGTRIIEDLLIQDGVDLSEWRLAFVTDISTDGRTFAGYGINDVNYNLGGYDPVRGWTATLSVVPEPTSAALLAAVLAAACLHRRIRKIGSQSMVTDTQNWRIWAKSVARFMPPRTGRAPTARSPHRKSPPRSPVHPETRSVGSHRPSTAAKKNCARSVPRWRAAPPIRRGKSASPRLRRSYPAKDQADHADLPFVGEVLIRCRNTRRCF